MQDKIEGWIADLRVLCQIARIEPQATYSFFISGFTHRSTNYMRTIPDIGKQLQYTGTVISTEFIPITTGDINCSEIKKGAPITPSNTWRTWYPVLF